MNDFNKDPLERFVQEHRDEFDLKEPSFELWDRIADSLPPDKEESAPKMVPLRLVLRMAAMVVVVLGAALMLFFQSSDNSDIRLKGRSIALHDISPELAEVEQHYMALIEAKLVTLKSSDILNGADYQSLIHEMEALDRDYEELKKELRNSLDKEKVIEAMIQNYRLRLKILEKMLQQVQVALLGLGIVSTIREMPEQDNRYGSRPIYELRMLNRREAQRFVEIVGFISERKCEIAKDLGTLSDRGDNIDVSPLLDEFYAESQGLPNAVRQTIVGRVSNGALTQQFVKDTVVEHTMLEETRYCKVNTSQFNYNNVLYTNGLMNYSLMVVGENDKLTQKQVDMLKRACYNEVIEIKSGEIHKNLEKRSYF